MKPNHPRENHSDEKPAFADLDAVQSIKFNSAQPRNDWKRERLGDLVTVHDKVRVPLSELERQKRRGNYPYCGANGVLDHIDGYLFDGDYVLLAEDGGYWEPFEDSAYLMHGRFWVNNHAHVLRARLGILDSQYLVDTLNYEDLTPYIHGTTRGKLNQGVMVEIPIALPPIEEQRAIARTLKAIQVAKEARQREFDLEREHKAALMQHLFTHGTRGEPTHRTDIGEIPEIWEVACVGDVAQITSGGTPARTCQGYWNGGIPWVKTGEIRYDTIHRTDETISQAGLDNSAAKIIPAGTLLMAMYGEGITRGKVAILGIDATLNQACAAILLSGKIATRFAFFYLQFAYERIRTLGHGANQRNLNAHLVGSIQIPIPTLEEQEAICRPLLALDAKLSALERECSLLDELFRAMLEELMTGRLSAVPLIAEHQTQ